MFLEAFEQLHATNKWLVEATEREQEQLDEMDYIQTLEKALRDFKSNIYN